MLIIDNDQYTIKIHQREDGYHICSYHIVTNEDYQLVESSGKKIIQRLIHSFSIYREVFGPEQMMNIIADLKSIAKSLKVCEEFVDEMTKKYCKIESSHN